MLERDFQSKLIKEIKIRLPGALVLKNDANYKQGVPDLLILYKQRWGALECKNRKDASRQPNQEYYVGCMNAMSFARFIYPENKEEVINEMVETFRN